MKRVSCAASLFMLTSLLTAIWQPVAATAPPTALTIARAPGFGSTVDLLWNAGGGPHTFRVYASTTYPVSLITPIYTTSLPGQHVPMGANPPYFFVVTDDDGMTGESGPSNTVGYTQIDGIGGIGSCYTYFGIPFTLWDGGGRSYGLPSTSPSDLFTDQFRCGLPGQADRVVDLHNGEFAYRNIPCAWAGILEVNNNLIFGHGMGFGILNNNSSRSVVVCGEADVSGNYGTTIVPPAGSDPGTSYIAWRDPRVLQINQLELINDGFQGGSGYPDSDRLISLGPVDAGAIAYCVNGSFTGNLTQVVPGQAYLIENVHAAPFNYSFNALLIP